MSQWYERAAANGEPFAMRNLAYQYEHSIGLARNLTKAIEWYRRAAENGHPDAGDSVRRLGG